MVAIVLMGSMNSGVIVLKGTLDQIAVLESIIAIPILVKMEDNAPTVKMVFVVIALMVILAMTAV